MAEREDGMFTQTETWEPIVTAYPLTAVLTIRQVADGLQCSTRTVERLDIPFTLLGKRLKRYVWGRVLDYLHEREIAA